MSAVLVVGVLSDDPRDPDIRVVSCHQHPSALDGLRVSEIHATEDAVRHPNFDRLALALRRSMAKFQR